ncbi:HlyD family secretion protein [Halosquirtibacter laminarini]|uniref:HlyD family secretion protein n=1 Tax=Halosquirtibacter laminarini TaxID=3374600 RepID=A0AC61NP41_9BACT|nr:HlyD family secretion protein [Prolixibacteraceae bacterium]
MKKKSLIAIIILVVLGSAYFVYEMFQVVETDDAQIESKITPITSRLDAFVDSVYIEDHQIVHKGDTLIQLDRVPFQLKIDQTKAQIDVLTEELQTDSIDLKNSYKEYQIQCLKQDEIKTAYWKVNSNYTRVEKMFQSHACTLDDFNTAKAENQMYQSRYDAQVLTTQKALLAHQKSKNNIERTLADRKEKIAELKLTKLTLSYTTITAPYAGKLYKTNIKKGQFIKRAQQITELTDIENLWIIANFKETQIEPLHIGTNVSIHVDAFPKNKLRGKIVSISPATGAKFALFPKDNATGNFIKVVQRVPIKIKFNKGEDINRLVPGLNVQVKIIK